MIEGIGWQKAFVAVSALLGEPSGAGALGETDAAQTSELLGALASPSREVRARAIARVITAVVADVERPRLT
jgi:hypothetical protein